MPPTFWQKILELEPPKIPCVNTYDPNIVWTWTDLCDLSNNILQKTKDFSPIIRDNNNIHSKTITSIIYKTKSHFCTNNNLFQISYLFRWFFIQFLFCIFGLSAVDVQVNLTECLDKHTIIQSLEHTNPYISTISYTTIHNAFKPLYTWAWKLYCVCKSTNNIWNSILIFRALYFGSQADTF